MLIPREIETQLTGAMQAQKVVLLLGARRVGKTMLLKKIQQELEEPFLSLNGDDLSAHQILAERSIANYRRLMGERRVLFLDEAQEIPDIGKKLKLMVDEIEGLRILASGSSAFELNHQIAEALVGRMHSFYLYPIAQMELNSVQDAIRSRAALEERLVLGSYPEILQLNSWQEKVLYLKELVNAYLLKDILAYEGIRKRELILQLLRKIAFRTGSEISMEALGRELQISKNTVEKYLDLFRKIFILYDLPGFSRNLDNEITKKRKWYFWDNGIRNALTGNFHLLAQRDDSGQLWENYLQSERLKKNAYQRSSAESYFWRTHSQQEIDLIENTADGIEAFEFKFGAGIAKIPPLFRKAYPDANFQSIHSGNFMEFLS